MSFIDQLRAARSTPTSILHKFLTAYDPNRKDRIHVFVEGEPDQAFYRSQIERHCGHLRKIEIYNCEGKKNVLRAHADVTFRFPLCEAVLFFVDKDVDDLIGVPCPQGSRIFETEWYSVEHYVISSESVVRYFQDFFKIRGTEVDFSHIRDEFEVQLSSFNQQMIPVMGWVIAAKRLGFQPIAQNINPAALLSIDSDCQLLRLSCRREALLRNATGLTAGNIDWKLVRAASREIKTLDPRQVVRGKFAAWLFISFLHRASELLSTIVREAGGRISSRLQINESNFIQILSPKLEPTVPLRSFLVAHLGT